MTWEQTTAVNKTFKRKEQEVSDWIFMLAMDWWLAGFHGAFSFPKWPLPLLCLLNKLGTTSQFLSVSSFPFLPIVFPLFLVPSVLFSPLLPWRNERCGIIPTVSSGTRGKERLVSFNMFCCWLVICLIQNIPHSLYSVCACVAVVWKVSSHWHAVSWMFLWLTPWACFKS